MAEFFLPAALVLLAAILALQILAVSRSAKVELPPLQGTFQSLKETSERTESAVRHEIARNREELSNSSRQAREELNQRISDFSRATDDRLASMREAIEQRLLALKDDCGEKLEKIQLESSSASAKASKGVQEQLQALSRVMRDEVGASLKLLGDTLVSSVTQLGQAQSKQMEAFAGQMQRLTELNQRKLEELKSGVEQKLTSIQHDNARQLEQMRQTVDEKLQGTLERRLGESFRQVSERLEQVHKGLGEMQVLATGVGDLKKVLSNVSTRGAWGETRLSAMLEQVLTPDQYDQNVATKDLGERVEFAIRLPGRSEEQGDHVWLPIDAKFPIEDYHRLLEAQESADTDAIDTAARQLENRMKACAASICEKYLNPPRTTDFAILFLPVEGLFAEVVRRNGLLEFLQREFHVAVAGPTTLWSLLNSLQLGFRTLAIQRRSSEVWKLLSAVKTEWSRYGDLLDKVQKKLQEASNTIDDAARRNRAIGKTLKRVQEMPTGDAEAVLMQANEEADGQYDGVDLPLFAVQNGRPR
jgi:DNA recombination protein RmuC